MIKALKSLTKFEYVLWISSLIIVLASSALSPERDIVTTLASAIGVTALIFVAKGRVIGQFLVVVFAVLYGAVSYEQRYYGEVITYIGMSAPMAIMSIISWLKNPNGDTGEVRVNRLTPAKFSAVCVLTFAVTVVFYFILSALGNSSIWWSTVSVATSFFAASLTFLRSPYYAVGYAANDVVLIVLWVIASFESPESIAMVACFVAFLANDLYGFINWRRMEKMQRKETNPN